MNRRLRSVKSKGMIMGYPNSLWIGLFATFALTATGTSSAREAEDRYILEEGELGESLADCQDGRLDGAAIIRACDAAISRVAGEQRSVALLSRSRAKLAAKDFDGAISDADAARDSFGSWLEDNQRCWTRAVAQRELEVAAQACASALGGSGASNAVIDSDAITSLLRQDWGRAANLYYLLSRLPLEGESEMQAALGLLLALEGAADNGEGEIRDMYMTKADAQRKRVQGMAHLSEGIAYFSRFGLSSATVVKLQ
jgi:hypothetical protein